MKTVKRKSSITYISKNVFKSDLSTASKVLYCFFADKAGWEDDDEGKEIMQTIPTKIELSNKLHIDRKTLTKSLDELVSKNYISIEEKEVTVYIPCSDGTFEKLDKDTRRNKFKISDCVKSYGGLVRVSKDVIFADITTNLKFTHFIISGMKLRDKEHISTLAAQYNISVDTFKKNFYKLVDMKYISYDITKFSEKANDKAISNLKIYNIPCDEIIVHKKEDISKLQEYNPYSAEEELETMISAENVEELMEQKKETIVENVEELMEQKKETIVEEENNTEIPKEYVKRLENLEDFRKREFIANYKKWNIYRREKFLNQYSIK